MSMCVTCITAEKKAGEWKLKSTGSIYGMVTTDAVHEQFTIPDFQMPAWADCLHLQRTDYDKLFSLIRNIPQHETDFHK